MQRLHKYHDVYQDKCLWGLGFWIFKNMSVLKDPELLGRCEHGEEDGQQQRDGRDRCAAQPRLPVHHHVHLRLHGSPQGRRGDAQEHRGLRDLLPNPSQHYKVLGRRLLHWLPALRDYVN